MRQEHTTEELPASWWSTNRGRGLPFKNTTIYVLQLGHISYGFCQSLFSYEPICRLIYHRGQSHHDSITSKSPSASNLTVSTWLRGDSLDPIKTEGENRFGWTTSSFSWTCPLVTLATTAGGLNELNQKIRCLKLGCWWIHMQRSKEGRESGCMAWGADQSLPVLVSILFFF